MAGKGNMERGSEKNYMRVTYRGYMEVIGEIAVDNCVSFEGVKLFVGRNCSQFQITELGLVSR